MQKRRPEPKPEPTKADMTAAFYRSLKNRGNALNRMGHLAVAQGFLEAADDIVVCAITQFGMTLDEISERV